MRGEKQKYYRDLELEFWSCRFLFTSVPPNREVLTHPNVCSYVLLSGKLIIGFLQGLTAAVLRFIMISAFRVLCRLSGY